MQWRRQRPTTRTKFPDPFQCRQGVPSMESTKQAAPGGWFPARGFPPAVPIRGKQENREEEPMGMRKSVAQVFRGRLFCRPTRAILSARSFSSSGPIVYRLGQRVFNPLSRVRLPVGLPLSTFTAETNPVSRCTDKKHSSGVWTGLTHSMLNCFSRAVDVRENDALWIG